METSSINRKQTAFRLREDLLEKLKIAARRENRSLNNYVENALMEVVFRTPGKDTMEAMDSARNGKDLTKVDMTDLDSFLTSLK